MTRVSRMAHGRRQFTYANRMQLAARFAKFFFLRAQICALTESANARMSELTLRMDSLPPYEPAASPAFPTMRSVKALQTE
jgi:hypothetical protein